MNPRKTVAELKLECSNNLARTLGYEKRDQEKPPLTAEQHDEVKRLAELIQQAMKCCARGMTVKGKKNPAFANLQVLVNIRRELLASRIPPKKQSDSELLREADRLLKGVQ